MENHSRPVPNTPPVRVLQVVTEMARGGLQTMLMNQYRRIDRTKLQYDFLTHRPRCAAYDDEIESLGGRIFRARPLSVQAVPSYLRWLGAFFDAHPEYRVVHAHLNRLSGYALWASKKAGVPVRIAHGHSTDADRDFRTLLRRISMFLIPVVATDLFACSVPAGEWSFGKRNRSGLRVISNAIDAKQFGYNSDTRAKVREGLGLTDCFVIGHVGRFFPAKHHEFLLEIYAEVVRRKRNTCLLLVGNGPQLSFIEGRAKRFGSRVRFLGVRTDVADLYQAMDAFVLPSLYEGLGIALIEAQAAGLPCFASDGVPGEAFITPDAEQVALSQGPIHWAERILASRGHERIDRSELIKAANYDIRAVAREMQAFYINAATN